MTSFLDIEGALDALANGGVVGLPTDTVYGIAACLAFPASVASLFDLKRRPMTVALPILVSSVAQIEALSVPWSPRAHQLSDAFWPGALTIIVEVPDELSRLVGSSTGTVGFRSPDDNLLLEILERSGPLALTSANEHGDPPCQTAAQVLEVFAGRSELSGVVDAGERSQPVSTVVDLSLIAWRLVREGAIQKDDLVAVLG
jgi:tRNA threonylcarbamoyl adenosine modification protein (Sua5/YciO/YrdC/YwlC family)